jgi:uncharacterized phosphatase
VTTPTSTGTPTTLCLVRHGETEWNLTHRYQGTTDIPLNETGRAQARRVAEALGRERWDAIVSSPLSRAMETARAIAATTGIQTIEEDRDLQERAYGEAEGLTLAEREKTWPGGDWPGLESWDDVATRVMTAIERIAAGHSGRRVIVVCHGGVINTILAVLSKSELGTGKTVIQNTSRTTVTRTGDGWTIDSVNETSHLEAVAAD